jgi:predicted Fe-Mo cluster-binding NifX family protein
MLSVNYTIASCKRRGEKTCRLHYRKSTYKGNVCLWNNLAYGKRGASAFSMRIAIPQWQGRVSPVFDVAVNLVLIDIENGQEIHREEKRFLETEPSARVAEFLSIKADILICGAISAPLQTRLTASGVQVTGFICGMIDEVLAAYLNGRLATPAFAMPGCLNECAQESD